MSEQNKVKCPLLNKEIDWGYCWELCNIATDDILLGIRPLRYVRSAVDIRASQKAPNSSPIFQRVNLKAPQSKRDTGDRGAPQKQ